MSSNASSGKSYDLASFHASAPSPLDRGRTFLSLFRIDVRRSQGYWLLPLMVGLGLYVPVSYDEGEVVLWARLNLDIVQSYVVIGPLAASLATWLAGRDRRRRVSGLAGTAPGSGFERDALAFASAATWGLAGYAVVFAWHGWHGLTQATWGGPDLPLIATGALAILLFVAVGVLVARLVRSKFAPLLALAVTFAVTIGSDALKISAGDGSYRQPLKLLMPWGLTSESYPDVFSPRSAPYEAEALTWLLGAMGVVLAVLALMRRRSIGAGAVLAMATVIAGTGAVALMERGEPWREVSGFVSFEWSCRESAGVEVCVHPAYEAVLDEAGAEVFAIVTPLAGLEGVPLRWEQAGPRAPAPGIGQLWQLQSPMIQWAVAEQVFPGAAPGGGPATMRPASQLVILHWLTERDGHDLGGTWPFGWPREVPHTEEQYGQGMYVPPQPDEAALAAYQPEFRAAVDRFAALSPAVQRAWLEANWAALRAGEIALDDMP